MMELNSLTEEELEILAKLRAMDEIEKLVFMTGFRALKSRQIDAEQFQAWTAERLDRHRAGEALSIADLQIPGASPAA